MYIAYKLNNYFLRILRKIFASNSRTRMLSDAAPQREKESQLDKKKELPAKET